MIALVVPCQVCGGTGRMAARQPEQPWEWALRMPCLHCAGRGAEPTPPRRQGRTR